MDYEVPAVVVGRRFSSRTTMAPKTSADCFTTKSTTSHRPTAPSKPSHAAKRTAESSSKATTRVVSMAVPGPGDSKGPTIVIPAPKKVKQAEPQPLAESQPDGGSVY
jgi:hypothetical protein